MKQISKCVYLTEDIAKSQDSFENVPLFTFYNRCLNSKLNLNDKMIILHIVIWLYCLLDTQRPQMLV